MSAATGASVLPKAAAANPSIFYSKSGEPRTVAQIYQHFAQKFDAGSGGGTVQMAHAKPSHSTHPYNVASAAPITAASMYSSLLAPISAPSHATMAGGASSPSANMTKITQAGSSTLFTAMLLGQMDGSGQAASSSLSAVQMADDRKKHALGVLSAVG